MFSLILCKSALGRGPKGCLKPGSATIAALHGTDRRADAPGAARHRSAAMSLPSMYYGSGGLRMPHPRPVRYVTEPARTARTPCALLGHKVIAKAVKNLSDPTRIGDEE